MYQHTMSQKVTIYQQQKNNGTAKSQRIGELEMSVTL